jgi:hypothetical protein
VVAQQATAEKDWGEVREVSTLLSIISFDVIIMMHIATAEANTSQLRTSEDLQHSENAILNLLSRLMLRRSKAPSRRKTDELLS